MEIEFSKDSDRKENSNTEYYTHSENKHLKVIHIQRNLHQEQKQFSTGQGKL
jgi:hypothetical protein